MQVHPSTGLEAGPEHSTGILFERRPHRGNADLEPRRRNDSTDGLITINLNTGAGKPVDKKVVNFGLSGDDSPVRSITIDLCERMVGWYDELAAPGEPRVTDTFVQIDQHTGVAIEFDDTGIDTHQAESSEGGKPPPPRDYFFSAGLACSVGLVSAFFAGAAAFAAGFGVQNSGSRATNSFEG